MVRVQIHLTKEQIEGLDKLAQGMSRAELIRRIIDEFLKGEIVKMIICAECIDEFLEKEKEK